MPLDLVADVRWRASRVRGQFEGVAQNAVDARPRHHGFLHDHFAIRAGEHAAADRRVLAFGVFADDEEVDVARLPAGERAGHPRQQANRSQIDVLIELPAHQQQRAPQRNMVRHDGRPADRAEENRVVRADPLLPVLGHHPAVPAVVVARGEIEFIDLQLESESLRCRVEHAHPFGDDFLADAVPGNDGDSVDARRRVSLGHYVE